MAITDADLKASSVQQMNAENAADYAAGLPVYADATRPDATSVPVGYTIFNTDDAAPNHSDGAVWKSSAGATT